MSADARAALADYLELERPRDADATSVAVFLSAASIASRRAGGRLSPRSLNTICEQIGRWHDAEHTDVDTAPPWPRVGALYRPNTSPPATSSGCDLYGELLDVLPRPARKTRYPWAVWTDGQARKIKRGRHFAGTVEGMRSTLSGSHSDSRDWYAINARRM